MMYFPSRSVMVPSVVPLTETETPGIVLPSSAEVTVPVISLVCAKTDCKPIVKIASNNAICFIEIILKFNSINLFCVYI